MSSKHSGRPKFNHLNLLGILLILAISSFFLFQRFNSPFDRIDDANSLIYSFYAKNLLRYPFSFHQLRNIDAVSPLRIPQLLSANNHAYFSHYLDHSPLITVLTAFSFLVFGPQESSARLVPILSSLGTLAIFFHLVKSKSTPSHALISTFFLGTFSLFLEHGQIINFEPTTLFFITLSLYLFDRYLNSTKSYLTVTLAFIVWFLAQLTDWPAAFALPAISFVLYKHKHTKLAAFALPFSLLGATMVLIYFSSVSTSSINTFVYSALYIPLTQPSSTGITPLNFLNAQKYFYVVNLTILPLLASSIWFLAYTSRVFKKILSLQSKIFTTPTTHPLEQVALWYLIIGSANTLIFYGWATSHRFWMYYLLPFFAITTTMVVVQLINSRFRYYLPLLLLIYFHHTTRNALRFIHNPAISQTDVQEYLLLKSLIPTNNVIFSNKNIYTLGYGRRLRYYIDRPIYIAQSQDQANTSGFNGNYWIIDNKDEHFINSLPGKKSILDPNFTLISRL